MQDQHSCEDSSPAWSKNDTKNNIFLKHRTPKIASAKVIQMRKIHSYQIVFVTSSLTQNAYNEKFFESHRSNKQISVVQWIVSSVKHQYSTPVKVNNMTLLIKLSQDHKHQLSLIHI